MILHAIASENIPEGSIISIFGNNCSIITTQEQFFKPNHAIFNALKDYKKGDSVEFEPRNFDHAVVLEQGNIKKLLNLEKHLDASGKKNVRKLMLKKAKAISKMGLC